MVSSLSGVSWLSKPSVWPENTPDWPAVTAVVSWAAWAVRAEIWASTSSREAWMAAEASPSPSPSLKVYSRL